MADKTGALKLDGVRGDICENLKFFAEKVIEGLGENLRNISVVGSSLTDDFRPGESDINSVVVLGEQTMESLKVISGLAKPMRKKKISAPLLMTPSYIERSRDVFGIEFLDFQLTHKTIYGDDPFMELNFDKKDVRLQCERELKAMLIRLRQGYIAAAANRKLVRDILISASKGLLVILRAMLWLKDIDRPARAEATFSRGAKEFSINIDPLITAWKWQYERSRPSETEIEKAFEAIYAVIEKLADIVDKREV